MRVRLRLFVLVAGILCLPACSVMDTMKSAATEMTTSAPKAGPYDPPPPSPWEAQPPATPTAAAPVPTPGAPAPQAAQPAVAATPGVPVAPPRKAERLPEPSYTPIYTPVQTAQPVATVAKPVSAPTKGAEKLMTINPGPAMQVHARELSPADQSSTGSQSTETSMIATADGQLIFKGPPRPPRSGPGFVRWILLSVFVGLLLAGGVFAFVQFQRKAAVVAAAPQPKEKPLEGLDMKEPAGHSPDTVLDA